MKGTGRSVGAGVAWTLGGYGTYLACQGGMVVALTRLGSPEQLGQFALGLAVSGPVFLLANLGLRRVLATDVASGYRFADYFGLRLLTSAAAAGAVAAIALAGGTRAETAAVVVAAGGAKAIEAAGDVVSGLFQQRGRMDLAARSLALRGVTGLAAVASGLALSGSVFTAVVWMGASWWAVLLLHDLPGAARVLGGGEALRPRWRAGPAAALAWLALPLGLVAAVGGLRASLPSYAIERHLGEAALGIFSALAYFPAAANRVASALGEAAGPHLARHYAARDGAAFCRLLGRLLAASLGLGAAGLGFAWLAGEPALRLFYGGRYAPHAGLLAALMAATAAWHVQTVLDYAMTASRRLRVQPLLYGGTAAVLAAACIALVPSGGLAGAALALGAAHAAELVAAGAVVAHAVLAIRAPRLSEATP